MKTLTQSQVDTMKLKGLTDQKIAELAKQKGYSLPTGKQESAYDKLINNPVTRGIQAFFPGKKLGEAVGGSVQSLYEGIKTGSMQPIADQAKTNTQNAGAIIGDTAKAITTPVTLAVNPATALGSAGVFGGLGAVSGAGKSWVEGNTPKQVAVDAFQSGLISAVTAGVLKGVSNKITQKAQNAPEKIYSNALRVTSKIKEGGKDPSKFLADKGVWGSLGTFKKASEEGIRSVDDAISQKVSVVPGGASFGEIKKLAIEKLHKELGTNLYTKAQISQLVDDVPLATLKKNGILNWKDINTTRSQLGRLVGDGKWASTNPSEKVKATQSVYRSMAGLLQKNTKTEKEFAEITKWINTKKVVDRALRIADSKYGLGLFDIVSGTGGVIAGAMTGDSLGQRARNAVIGGSVAFGAERLASSPAVKTGLVQLISKLPVDSAGKISRAALMQIISSLSAGDSSNQPNN